MAKQESGKEPPIQKSVYECNSYRHLQTGLQKCHKGTRYCAMEDFTAVETSRVILAAKTIRSLLYQKLQVNVSRTFTAICFLY